MKSRAVWSKVTWQKAIEEEAFKQQTELLVDYAKREIDRIGNDISAYGGGHNLDRTGNLLDSLCWGVFYDGKLKDFGYYRKEQAGEDSHLHEWSNPMGRAVNGHFEASQFIANYKSGAQKWEVFFAVVAPYWGYWEEGFTMKKSGVTLQWQVMTRHFDTVTDDLQGAAVEYHTYIPA